MTNKELQEKLKQYPDDAVVHAELFTRNGRGGAFQEDLLLNSMGYFEKENMLHIECAFQIGWLNAHPEFQPPAEPEEEEPEETGEEPGTVEQGREEEPSLRRCRCGEMPRLARDPSGRWYYVCLNCMRRGDGATVREQAADLWNDHMRQIG